MDPTASAVVIAGLAAGAAKPAADLVKDFLGRVLNPAGDAVGEAVAFPIREWQRKRVERANRIVLDAATVVITEQIEPQQVPGRVFGPLIEKASVEEDEEL